MRVCIKGSTKMDIWLIWVITVENEHFGKSGFVRQELHRQ